MKILIRQIDVAEASVFTIQTIASSHVSVISVHGQGID